MKQTSDHSIVQTLRIVLINWNSNSGQNIIKHEYHRVFLLFVTREKVTRSSK